MCRIKNDVECKKVKVGVRAETRLQKHWNTSLAISFWQIKTSTPLFPANASIKWPRLFMMGKKDVKYSIQTLITGSYVTEYHMVSNSRVSSYFDFREWLLSHRDNFIKWASIWIIFASFWSSINALQLCNRSFCNNRADWIDVNVWKKTSSKVIFEVVWYLRWGLLRGTPALLVRSWPTIICTVPFTA